MNSGMAKFKLHPKKPRHTTDSDWAWIDEIEDYAVFRIDREGRVVTWNLGAECIFGYPAAEIDGQHFSSLFTPEEVKRGEPETELSRAAREGRSEGERWQCRRDGERFWAWGVITALYDENGDARGFVEVLRDETAHKRAEDERETSLERERASRAEAEAASRLKDEFFATLSHELRGPLTTILGHAEILLRNPQTSHLPSIRRAAATIHRNAVAQAQLINDLLDLSRLQTGKLALNRQPISLSSIIADAVEAARAIAPRHISLIEELAPEPLIVEADPVRVQQIVWNLLSNAFKFTMSGGQVRVFLTQEDGEAKLAVEDTGQGIAPKFLPHVFEMFRQADAHATRRLGGMGIGLALVRHLVELHGGRVEAASEGIGRGARFTVRLPLQRAVPETCSVASPEAIKELSGLRILVVDDAPDTVEMMQIMLEFEGAMVTTATSAAEALQIAEATDFDLILSDITMPEIDGYALLRELRKRPRTAQTPAVALTGYGRGEDVEQERDAGFDSHLTKPVLLEELVKVVRNLI